MLNVNNTGNMKHGRINLKRFNPGKLQFIVLLLKWRNIAVNFFIEKWATLEGIFQNLVKIKGLNRMSS